MTSRTIIIERPTLAEAREQATRWLTLSSPDEWNRIRVEHHADGCRITIEVQDDRG